MPRLPAQLKVRVCTVSIYGDSSRWTAAGGAYSSLETTYPVPDTATPERRSQLRCGNDHGPGQRNEDRRPHQHLRDHARHEPCRTVNRQPRGPGFDSLTASSAIAGGISSDPTVRRLRDSR